jgi:hypothetical protein
MLGRTLSPPLSTLPPLGLCSALASFPKHLAPPFLHPEQVYCGEDCRASHARAHELVCSGGQQASEASYSRSQRLEAMIERHSALLATRAALQNALHLPPGPRHADMPGPLASRAPLGPAPAAARAWRAQSPAFRHGCRRRVCRASGTLSSCPPAHSYACGTGHLGLRRSGFDPPGLERPSRQLHQQGLSETSQAQARD